MASVEPGASAATWRSVATIASLVRYMLTPVDATTAGCPDLEVDWHQPQERRYAEAEVEVDGALALPRLRSGPIHLEHEQTGGKLRPTLGEGIQARSNDDVLPDAAGSLLRNEIFDEAGTGHDGCAEGPRERGHIRTVTPSMPRSTKTHFVA